MWWIRAWPCSWMRFSPRISGGEEEPRFNSFETFTFLQFREEMCIDRKRKGKMLIIKLVFSFVVVSKSLKCAKSNANCYHKRVFSSAQSTAVEVDLELENTSTTQHLLEYGTWLKYDRVAGWVLHQEYLDCERTRNNRFLIPSKCSESQWIPNCSCHNIHASN